MRMFLPLVLSMVLLFAACFPGLPEVDAACGRQRVKIIQRVSVSSCSRPAVVRERAVSVQRGCVECQSVQKVAAPAKK